MPPQPPTLGKVADAGHGYCGLPQCPATQTMRSAEQPQSPQSPNAAVSCPEAYHQDITRQDFAIFVRAAARPYILNAYVQSSHHASGHRRPDGASVALG